MPHQDKVGEVVTSLYRRTFAMATLRVRLAAPGSDSRRRTGCLTPSVAVADVPHSVADLLLRRLATFFGLVDVLDVVFLEI